MFVTFKQNYLFKSEVCRVRVREIESIGDIFFDGKSYIPHCKQNWNTELLSPNS